MTQVDCFINNVWSNFVLLSTFAELSLINFFRMMYNDVGKKILVVDVLFCYILMTWNMYVCMYVYVHCDEIKDLLLLLFLFLLYEFFAQECSNRTSRTTQRIKKIIYKSFTLANTKRHKITMLSLKVVYVFEIFDLLYIAVRESVDHIGTILQYFCPTQR